MNDKNPQKRVHSKRRLKEWERRPFPFSRWQRLFHFEKIESVLYFGLPLFKWTGLYHRGRRNANTFRHRYVTMYFNELPADFDGYSILFAADFHVEENGPLMQKVADYVMPLEHDVALLGGDYRFRSHGSFDAGIEILETFVKALSTRYGIFGVLGNHDSWEMIDDLENIGITMMINDAIALKNGSRNIRLVGFDDAHYYQSHDWKTAASETEDKPFTIVLSHSNDALADDRHTQPDLFLCGHTHGGQICFPGIGPLLVHSKLPREYSNGIWEYNGVRGLTTSGLGASGIPVRFNCPAEIVTIVLKQG